MFSTWASEIGCELRVDAIGNVFARRAGLDPSRSAVATGSHLDTQPTGGKFDGNYGLPGGSRSRCKPGTMRISEPQAPLGGLCLDQRRRLPALCRS
jgi:hypothetical protein